MWQCRNKDDKKKIVVFFYLTIKTAASNTGTFYIVEKIGLSALK